MIADATQPLVAGTSSPWPALLLAATALHAGFQATVTLLVYPALADVPGSRWQEAHDRHSRRITPLVALVYGAALVTCLGTLLTAEHTAGLWVAVLGTAGAFAVTAVGAAPTHGRLGQGRSDALVERLALLDRLRLGCATLALLGALALVLA